MVGKTSVFSLKGSDSTPLDSLGTVGDGVLKVVPGGDAAGQVGDTGMNFGAVLVWCEDYGVDVFHGGSPLKELGYSSTGSFN